MEQNELNVLIAEINTKCWDDEDFKRRFIAEPKKVLQEYKIPYSEETEYCVLEAAENESILVLPVKGAAEILFKVAETVNKNFDNQTLVPEGKKLTIVQNTEKLTYLVIKNLKNVSPNIEFLGEGWEKYVDGFLFTTANIIVFANAVIFSNAVATTEAVAALDVAAGAVAVAVAAVI